MSSNNRCGNEHHTKLTIHSRKHLPGAFSRLYVYASASTTLAWQSEHSKTTCMTFYRSKYVGEGSAACMLGLFTGLCILVMQKYLTEEALHQVGRMPTVHTVSPAWLVFTQGVCLLLQATRVLCPRHFQLPLQHCLLSE